MNPLSRFFPWAVLIVAVVILLVVVVPPSDAEKKVHLYEASRLPVLDQGRVKPLDSLARTTLLQISERQQYRDEDGNVQPAIGWFLDVISSNRKREHYPSEELKAFHIDNDWLRTLLQLPARREALYSFQEIGGHFDQFKGEVKRIMELPPGQRTVNDTSLLNLLNQVIAYAQLRSCETPHKVFRIVEPEVLNLLLLKPRPGFYEYSFSEILPRISLLFKESERILNQGKDKRSLFDSKVLELCTNVLRYLSVADPTLETLHYVEAQYLGLENPTLERLRELERYLGLEEVETLRLVPPSAPGQSWLTYEAATKEDQHPAFAKLVDTYRPENPDEFNQALARYQADLAQQMPGNVRRVDFEEFYNHAAPFYMCIWLYGIVFLFTCLSWLVWGEPLRRAAFWLLVLALMVQTFGMLARMYLLGRPMVLITNLYATAVFIGWIGGFIGLAVELLFPRGIGLAVAALLAFLTAIVGHNLAGGDTLRNVEAVLDTNFWLATHVTTVNIGYAVVLFAGLLGAALILAGLFLTALDRDLYRILGQVLYGILCFGLFFSFVGTVLGGIWADQSWGRFWGWDPKENGALLIVLMCALILHARWAGLIQTRGMAVLAVLGNIVVIWSWFQVNMLGVGLHSYGAAPERMKWVILAYVVHLIVAGLGLLPMPVWRSYAALQPADALPVSPREPRSRQHGVPITSVTR